MSGPSSSLNAAATLPGRDESLWLATAPPASYGRLDGDADADVAVIGAGITGLLTALRVVEAGLSVAVIEARTIGSGATGYTSAKLSSLHGLSYATLIRTVGRERAGLHGAANEAGIAAIAEVIDRHEIDCHFRRRDNYAYALTQEDLPDVEAEARAAKELGLPAQLARETPLPFPVVGAVRFLAQAEFHPQRFLLGLAERIVRAGGRVHEHTRTTSVDDAEPCRVRTDGGTLRAGHVVVATHLPFLDRGLYFARTHPERSYCIAVRIAGTPPEGMFLSTEQPAHSIRSHPIDGEELLIVGGESHKTGQGGDTRERYLRLERFAREHFDVRSIEYRWSTQDEMPADGLPLIGRLWPFSGRLLTATGYKKWGLAQAATAADLLRDLALGNESRWRKLYTPTRLRPQAAAKDLVVENVNVAKRLFGDRLTQRAPRDFSPAPGEGRVVSDRGRQIAVCRDDAGTLHALSARCPHLGCIVNWNTAERSWDCPCHGSRFAADGEVLEGPAVAPLARRDSGGFADRA